MVGEKSKLGGNLYHDKDRNHSRKHAPESKDRLPQLPYSGSTTNSNMKSGSAVKALGEVALRVNNLERMKRFYQEVLGFEVLGEFRLVEPAEPVAL